MPLSKLSNSEFVPLTRKGRAELQAKRDIMEAILASSPEHLEKVIQCSPDDIINCPYLSVSHPKEYNEFGAFKEFKDGGEKDFGEEDMIALQEDSFTFPLHVAVICVYHAIQRDGYCHHHLKQALRVIDVLISHGAMASLGTGVLYVLNCQGYEWVIFNRNYPNNKAVNLAMELKRYPWSSYENETHRYLEVVKKKLDAAAVPKRLTKLPTQKVLKDVISAYDKLLFSEDFSDITFECCDGVSVPAHKNILAASSEYFKAAFLGGWAESNSKVWKVIHSSKIIKAILTILYTGSVEKCNELLKDKDVDQMTLFELSSEYGIEMLISLSGNNCIKSIDKSNLKKFLKSAKLYSNKKLKMACFDYIQRNTVCTLTDPNFMTLATEDAELWGELRSFLDEKSKKRARTE